jgi:hypothetical protein
VRRSIRTHQFDALVMVQSACEVIEERLAVAEHDRHDHDMHLIHQVGAQELLNRRRAAAQQDVLAVGFIERHSQDRIGSVVDEVESRSTLPSERLSPMVGQYEDVVVKR